MKTLWILGMLIAAAINLAPALGAFAPARMSALYGLPIEDGTLEILMRHRAVLFGIVGGLLVAALFVREPRFQVAAYVVGFVSMISFLVVAAVVGSPSEAMRRVAAADIVGIVALAGAAGIHYGWLRAEL